MKDKIPNGSELKADGLNHVGYCKHCRRIQTVLYMLDGELYCIACFPLVVDLKLALRKLGESNNSGA